MPARNSYFSNRLLAKEYMSIEVPSKIQGA